MKRILILLFLMGGCANTNKAFYPTTDYPPDPWVKGYANKDDCLGGEKLAARQFALPQYPKRAYKKGRQGWVILRLDVDKAGVTKNVRIERSLPQGEFSKNARQAAENWTFQPPANLLTNCRVLIRYRLGTVSLGG